MNRCGACTLCCKLTEVPELAKPVNQWCQFCSDGCSRYDNRPASCVNFECLWFANETLPESLRPDNCHVVFERLHGYQIFLALVDPDHKMAWIRGDVPKLIGTLQRQEYAVAVSPDRHVFLPVGKTVEQVNFEILEFARKVMQ